MFLAGHGWRLPKKSSQRCRKQRGVQNTRLFRKRYMSWKHLRPTAGSKVQSETLQLHAQLRVAEAGTTGTGH